MKKQTILLISFLVFLFIYFLQSNFFSWFTIAGVRPNLFVILVLFLSLFAGKNIGVQTGIFFGICLDFFISKKIGISGIMLGIIGLLGGYFEKNFSKDSRITIMIMIIGSTIIFEVGSYFLNYAILKTNLEIQAFIKILVIEIIYNTLITIILYPLLQKIGYRIENEFNGSRILTRYF